MKKLGILILALLVGAAFLIPVVVSADEPTLVEGDANLDGRCSIIDAMVIAQHSIDKDGSRGILCIPWSDDNDECGDVNDDGRCSIIDAMIVAQYTIDPDQSRGILCIPLWDPVADAHMLPPG